MQQVIDLVSDSYLLVDKHMHLTIYNKTLLQMFPDTGDIAIGKSLEPFFNQSFIDVSYDDILELQKTAVDLNETAVINACINHETFVSVEITPVIRHHSHVGSIILVKNINTSMKDQLTGIANRRSFDDRLDTEWTRAIRGQSSICLMMIDVDHFKKYNDTYGHQQGDVALQIVAKVLSKSVKRPTDFVARWGGEEFAVLLPYSDVEGSMQIAELIRSNIENVDVPLEDGTITKITASIGINVELPAQTSVLENFIEKADQALYAAKKDGRNRVNVIQVE
jgi:diguanylate cyclase (GGDEF)-like protein